MKCLDVIMILREIGPVPFLVKIRKIAEFPAMKGGLPLLCEFVEVTIMFNGLVIVLPR